MTPNELAAFLRERVPRIKRHAVEFPWKDAHREDEAALFSALDAAVGLLRQAEGVIAQAQWGPDMNRCPYCNNPKPHHIGGCWLSDTLTALATLRLVGREKEDREC